MSNIQKLLKWSETEILLEDFCNEDNNNNNNNNNNKNKNNKNNNNNNNNNNDVPCIFKVTSGYYGTGDLTIGSEEIFFLYHYSIEKRLLCRDLNGRTISIPNKSPLLFTIYNEKEKIIKENISIIDIITKWVDNKNKIFFIKIKNNQQVACNYEAKWEKLEKLGILKIIDIIDLKYALVNAFSDGISNKTIAIPDYFNIHVTKAIGLEGLTEEQFSKWLICLNNLISLHRVIFNQMSHEIIVFQQTNFSPKSSCHYDHLTQIERLSNHDYKTLDFPDIHQFISIPKKINDNNNNNDLQKREYKNKNLNNNNNNNNFILPIISKDEIRKSSLSNGCQGTICNKKNFKFKPKLPTPSSSEDDSDYEYFELDVINKNNNN